MDYSSLFISGISLVLSTITIYYTLMRPAKLKIFVGPFIIITRHNSYFAFNIPTTIANRSNQTGVIKRATMIITHNDTPQQNYHMLWNSFRKISSDGSTWIQYDTVSSIAIIAKSTENRNIEYQGKFESIPKLCLKKGTYQVRFYYWSNKPRPIVFLKHEIYIDENQETHFGNPEMIGKIIQLTVDNDMNMNEILTKNQVEKI